MKELGNSANGTTSDESASVARLQSVRFSTLLFDIATIKKAAYRMTALCAFEFAVEGEDIVCTLRPLSERAGPIAQEIVETFRTEVLDQDLRRIVGAETEPIRNAILAYAFSRTGLQKDD